MAIWSINHPPPWENVIQNINLDGVNYMPGRKVFLKLYLLWHIFWLFKKTCELKKYLSRMLCLKDLISYKVNSLI